MSRMMPGLDGLRAIAFLRVFALHTDYLQIGWVGALFVVLSGFLITGSLLDMKKALVSNNYFLKFYGRCFLCIFPCIIFYLFLIVILTIWLISIHYHPCYMQTGAWNSKAAKSALAGQDAGRGVDRFCDFRTSGDFSQLFSRAEVLRVYPPQHERSAGIMAAG